MTRTIIGDERDTGLEFVLKCRGLTRQEFFGLYHALAQEFGKPGMIPRVRNPVPPFTPKEIHDILLTVGWTQLGVSVGKRVANHVINKTAELMAKFVEKKLLGSGTAQKKKVTIYGPNDKALYDIEFKDDKKPKRLK
jgi:hypothetical protein